MTERELEQLENMCEGYGYGYVMQLVTGLWSHSWEAQGFSKYDVPAGFIFPKGVTEQRRKAEIDTARYAVDSIRNNGQMD